MFKRLDRRCPPERYVCQDFKPLFSAPGWWDRPSAKRLILHAREVLTELRAVTKRRRELSKQLRELALLIESTINNDPPSRSP